MTDNHIDAAIDRAVRDMMSVDAPEQIRARVLAGLERREPRVFGPARIAFAGTTALLVAFVLFRMPWPGDPAQRAVPSASVVAPVGSVDGLAGVTAGSPQVPPAVPTRSSVVPTVAAAAPVGLPDTIPPLEDLDPVVVPAPQLADIELAAVTIAPLATIPDVVVEPLPFPPGSRD